MLFTQISTSRELILSRDKILGKKFLNIFYFILLSWHLKEIYGLYYIFMVLIHFWSIRELLKIFTGSKRLFMLSMYFLVIKNTLFADQELYIQVNQNKKSIGTINFHKQSVLLSCLSVYVGGRARRGDATSDFLFDKLYKLKNRIRK